MASRSRSSSRRERDSDGADSLKPLVVLVLLGTIIYGAWSVVTKGPGGMPPDGVRADLAAAPPFAATPDLASALPSTPPPLAPPAVSSGPLAAAAPAAVTPAQPFAAPAPAAPAADPAPTYLSAAPAAPPTADPLAGGPAGPPGGSLPPDFAATRGAVPPSPFPPPQAVDVGPDPRALPAAPPPAPAAVSRTAAFASAWTDAHEKLTSGRYAEALAVLSLWYDDPALGPEESQRLEDLLNQLAGTVIWSQQDLLRPPHVVAAGETLGTIAAPLGIPWQVLAKINGVADPVRLVPGESLKMLSGPFDALVSVSRRRLSLQVNACYAGSFPVVVGRQIRERVGGSLSVLAAANAPGAAAADGAAQVAWAQPGPRSIPLSGGIVIEAVPDPTVVSEESIGPTSLVVSERDLAELADMLGQGSRVLIRQ